MLFIFLLLLFVVAAAAVVVDIIVVVVGQAELQGSPMVRFLRTYATIRVAAF